MKPAVKLRSIELALRRSFAGIGYCNAGDNISGHFEEKLNDTTSWTKTMVSYRKISKQGVPPVEFVTVNNNLTQEALLDVTWSAQWNGTPKFQINVEITIPKWLSFGLQGRVATGVFAMAVDSNTTTSNPMPTWTVDVDPWLQGAVVEPWLNAVIPPPSAVGSYTYAFSLQGRVKKLLTLPKIKLQWYSDIDPHWSSGMKEFWLAFKYNIRVESNDLRFINGPVSFDPLHDDENETSSSDHSDYEWLDFMADDA